MEIVPVLDLLGGQAVHAIGGDRASYRVVQSRLGHGSAPVALAGRMVVTIASRSLYVADLGAITGGRRHEDLILELKANGSPHLYWDAGLVKSVERDRLPTGPDFVPIWASETADARDLAENPPNGACAFSVDLSGGVILGDWLAWGIRDARDAPGLAAAGVRLTGATTVIVLDLRGVGVRGGPIGAELIERVRARLPAGVRLGVGGGIRNDGDLTRLDAIGVDFVLVATAIHDGTLTLPHRSTTAG